jgi:serine/threonine-protein kinase
MSGEGALEVPAGTVILNRYRVVRLLGKGGYGAVYLAHDTRLGDKKVAVKQSFDTSSDSQQQFSLEAQLLAKLDHSNLPRVTDYFTDSTGSLFLVMDFIEGEDLWDRCALARGTPGVSAREAAAIMLQICEAVAYLHGQHPHPIIHRDIKPFNIKLCTSGRAMLVDFGIAKVYQPTKGTVRVAKAISPPFSPPEQYGGKTDMRSDVYALGATLYVLLCKDELPDAMERSTQSLPAVPPCISNPTIPSTLETIITRSIDLDPARRYANATEMAAALRAFLAGQPLPAVAAAKAAAAPGTVCPRCGLVNRAGARFCTRDGTPLNSGGAPVVSMPPEARFEVANEYANKKLYEQAICEYQLCLRDQFSHAAVYHNLGLCYRLAKHSQEARFALTRGVTLYPNDEDLRFQLAMACYELKDYDSAADSMLYAIHLNPADEDNWMHLVKMLVEAKRVEEAINALEKAIRTRPNSARFYCELGRIHLLNDQVDKALSQLRKAVQLDKKMFEAHLWLGIAHFRKKKFNEALKSFTEVTRLDPSIGLAHFFIGRVYLEQDRFHEGAAAFARAGGLMKTDPDPYLFMAVCYMGLNQRQEALNAVNHALAVNPGYADALELRAKIMS